MQAWDKFLTHLEKEFGKDTVNKWIRTLKVTDFDACNLYLQAKDSFQILWFEEHIRKKVVESFVNNNNKKIKIHLSLTGSKDDSKGNNKQSKENEEPKPPEFTFAFDKLDPYATFENFVVSEENLLAYKLLCKITNYDSISNTVIPSEEFLASFNPVYLYGGEGAGKTHLLMATAHALRSRGLNVIYARGETFTEHVVSAIRGGQMSLFRQTYRNIDVLLLDNIHIFSRKNATQEELFHTFNTLHLAGKQIILAANCAPPELQYIEPRLVSRFEWGIVLPLEQIKPENVKEVIEQKAKTLDFTLHPKVTEFLLKSFSSSTKSINRALEALILRTHMKSGTHGTVSVALAKHLLEDLLKEEVDSALTPQKIVHVVAEFFGICTSDILGKAQSRDCVLPRQLSMYLCREKLKMPFIKIGDIFSRDHSTVMSSVKQIQKGLDEDSKEITTPYTAITKKIKK